MATINDEVVSTLNELIEACRDGEEGFRTAAQAVDDDHLRTLFNNYCQQRAQLAAELQREVLRLGSQPQSSGSTAGALHRGWVNLKSAIAGHDDGAVLSECERGEDVAIEQYQHALNANLPSNIKQVVSRQYAAINAAHDRIRELEKAHEKAS